MYEDKVMMINPYRKVRIESIDLCLHRDQYTVKPPLFPGGVEKVLPGRAGRTYSPRPVSPGPTI